MAYATTHPCLMLMDMGKLLLDQLLMSMELGEGKLEMEGLSGYFIYTDAGLLILICTRRGMMTLLDLQGAGSE